MSADSAPTEDAGATPEPIRAYLQHLAAERRLSPHTLAFMTADHLGTRVAHADNPLARACEDFNSLGCDIRRREEWRGPVTFHDVGALVYFLKAIPWVVEDFEVEGFRDVLESLHREVQSGGPPRFTYSRFLVQAVRT